MEENLTTLLEAHGLRVTANRILVLKALNEFSGPATMTDLETEIASMDKSSIFRTLVSFREHHLVHTIETCGEGTKYEICHSSHDEGESDEHVHFHCSVCHRTYCFEDIPIPPAPLPEGFEAEEVNYVVSGICPDCRNRRR